jgi:uncharacterized protein YjbI with pentapeptide repeats
MKKGKTALERFLKRYYAGERDFSGMKLTCIDLSSVNLRDERFRRANLSNANF